MQLNKISSAIVMLVSALGFASAWAAEDCSLNGVSVSQDNGSTTAGKSGMVRCLDRDTGKLARERELKAGNWVGMTRDYTDGVLRLEYGRDEQGREHGPTRKFAANKQILLEELYEHGKRVGVVREWYPDGKLRSAEVHGATDSESAKARFTPKGQLNNLDCAAKPLLAPHVDDATLCGFKGKASTIEYFHDEGKPRGRETYLAGVTQEFQEFDFNTGKLKTSIVGRGKQKIETEYHPDGGKRLETEWDTAEKPQAVLRKTEFHANGSMLQQQHYAMVDFAGKRRNLLTLDASYFMNGQPKTRESFKTEGQERVKTVQIFHDNGKLYSQGSFIEENQYRQRAIGIHQLYSEQGVLLQEQHHDSKGNVQRERNFDEKGALKNDELLFEDGSRKAYAK
jgi:antitoxin component YwqK of YwqJK toxin-antitoxin module